MALDVPDLLGVADRLFEVRTRKPDVLPDVLRTPPGLRVLGTQTAKLGDQRRRALKSVFGNHQLMMPQCNATCQQCRATGCAQGTAPNLDAPEFAGIRSDLARPFHRAKADMGWVTCPTRWSQRIVATLIMLGPWRAPTTRTGTPCAGFRRSFVRTPDRLPRRLPRSGKGLG